MKHWFIVALLLPLMIACGKPAEKPDTPESSASTNTTPKPRARIADVYIVDLAGNPLSRMVPIVTRQPNAFDEPLRRGMPTGSDGRSSVSVPPNEQVYIRAWDDTLHYFANNYLTVTVGSGSISEVLTVQMIEAAAVTVQVMLPSGEFAVNEEMVLRLNHPTEGPWWPAPGQSDEFGVVQFKPVPAGAYTFELLTKNGFGIEIPERLLAPGEAVDWGVLLLMQRDNTKNTHKSQ